MSRSTSILNALHGFFSRFADAYAEGCAPEGAAFPYITYALIVPEELETATFYARVWHRTRRYEDIAALLDDIGDAIGPGCRVPTDTGGAVWIYKSDRFIQFMPVRDDPDLKCAYLNLAIAANTF